MTTVSLFCGAGGESAGKALAMADLGLTPDVAHAVNHWNLAVQVHGRNFPHVVVHQEDITQVTAADFGLERIDILWASPSCVHHSRARGGKPRDDQQRSHAHEVLERWLKVALVDVLLVENVPEFAEWGPLDDEGRPIKERKGEFFNAFLDDLRAIGYRLEWRILCAADYGDPTTRRRFFMQAVRDGVPITWPQPTHADPRKPRGLFDPELKPWRTAAECIDWSLPVPSIFDRKKPLADNTLRRIAAGVDRYVLHGKPFLVDLPEGPAAASLIQYHTETSAQARVSNLTDPLPTLDTSNRFGLVAAFLAQTGYGERVGQAPRSMPADRPLGTVVARGQKHAVVAASLIGIDHGSGNAHWPTDAPLSTATTKARHALVAAFLTHYYGTAVGSSPADPMDTVTTKDRHGLVTVLIDGQTYAVADIGMRMLEPHELAKAMSLPPWFVFERADGGVLSKKDTVKMIGNMVPVETARALVRHVARQRRATYRRTA